MAYFIYSMTISRVESGEEIPISSAYKVAPLFIQKDEDGIIQFQDFYN
jgi:hypothetical protein